MSEKVRVSLGVTKNLGNFESMRFDYDYETDVRPGESEQDAMDRAHQFVYTYLDKKIQEEFK